MLNEKDKKDIEKDIKKKTNKKDEEVQIKVTNKKRSFNKFKVKYKKDKKKYIVALTAIALMFSITIGSSYAYLTYVSKTNNTVTINAGTLALVFQNETNTINIQNAVPVKDSVGLEQQQEYSFDIKNNGSIPASYKITLQNTCQTSSQIDLCIPDEYIKVGLKVGSNDYKVVERNEKNEYILDTGSLGKTASQTYKMKIWLDHETPNTYNPKGGKTVVYSGKLGLTYEQGTKPMITLDANGGTIPVGQDWTGSGETATKTVETGATYGTLPNPTRSGYAFAGWTGKNLVNVENHNVNIEDYYYKDNIPMPKYTLEASTNYILSFNYIVNSASKSVYATVGYGSTGFQRDIKSSGSYTNNGRLILQFSAPDSFAYNPPYVAFRFVRMSTQGDANVDILNIQLEKGTEATSYEPYKEYSSSTTVDKSTSHTLYAKWTKNS